MFDSTTTEATTTSYHIRRWSDHTPSVVTEGNWSSALDAQRSLLAHPEWSEYSTHNEVVLHTRTVVTTTQIESLPTQLVAELNLELLAQAQA